jgi:hypothetical protein
MRKKGFDETTFDIALRRDVMRRLRRDVGVRRRPKKMMLFALSYTAAAQVVIPFGNFDNTERYLVAGLTLAVLAFAMWRYFRKGR